MLICYVPRRHFSSWLQFIRWLFMAVLLRQTRWGPWEGFQSCTGERIAYPAPPRTGSCPGTSAVNIRSLEGITAVFEFMRYFILCHISQDNHRAMIIFGRKALLSFQAAQEWLQRNLPRTGLARFIFHKRIHLHVVVEATPASAWPQRKGALASQHPYSCSNAQQRVASRTTLTRLLLHRALNYCQERARNVQITGQTLTKTRYQQANQNNFYRKGRLKGRQGAPRSWWEERRSPRTEAQARAATPGQSSHTTPFSRLKAIRYNWCRQGYTSPSTLVLFQ